MLTGVIYGPAYSITILKLLSKWQAPASTTCGLVRHTHTHTTHTNRLTHTHTHTTHTHTHTHPHPHHTHTLTNTHKTNRLFLPSLRHELKHRRHLYEEAAMTERNTKHSLLVLPRLQEITCTLPDSVCQATYGSRLRLKRDGTRVETRFRLSGETDESI